VLTTEGHHGKTYNLNGPDVLSSPKVAAIWSELLGREIQYAGHDMNVFERQMRERMPSWRAFDLRMMFQSYLERGSAAFDFDQGVEELAERLDKLLRSKLWPPSLKSFAISDNFSFNRRTNGHV